MPPHAAAALGILATSVLLSGAAPAAGGLMTLSPIRVRLELIRASLITDEALDAATGEAAAIWAPHGVTVLSALGPPALDEADADVRIKLIVRESPANRVDGRTPSGYRALASLVFVGPTEPGKVMFASLGSARQTVRAAKLERWPAAVLERLAMRLLGRAIAHELGHYLLRSRDHSETGLMRASFDRRDVVAKDVAGLGLDPEQADALQARRTDLQLARAGHGASR